MSAGPLVLVDGRKARDWGIGAYVRALLAGMAERGGFELVALALPGDAGLFPPGVRVVPCDAPHYSLSELVRVRAALGRVRPDLFHAPHYVLPLFPPARTVVTVHDLMHLHRVEHASPAKRAYARAMLGRAARLSRRVLVNSAATRDELVAFAPSTAAKIRITPPALDPRFLAPAVPAARPPYVLFVGNDKPHKNLAGLFAAFAASGLPHRLVLAGGPEANRAARAALGAAHGLAGRVDDLGFVEDAELPPLMAGAAALVLPSFAEGFGIPALEALAVGTPVVCSDLPALREATGGHALFADPARPATFAAALARAVHDAPLRASLAARGREHAAAFTRSRLAEQTAAAWNEALA